MKTAQNAALVVEDDVILPNNIDTLLANIEDNIDTNEVILLYYTAFKPTKLSKVASTSLSHGSLYYSLDLDQTMTTTAYVIGRKAAENMAKNIQPVRVTADTWNYFYIKKYFTSLRVHYPSVINTKNFKSSIDYMKAKSLKKKITAFINYYQLPVFFQVLQYLRGRKLQKMLNRYSLTDEVSPIYQNLKL